MSEAREGDSPPRPRTLADVEPDAEPVGFSPSAGPTDPAALVALFAERVADYLALAERCPAADLARVVTAATRTAPGWSSRPGCRSSCPGAVLDDIFTAAELNQFDTVFTDGRHGVAKTGTIVLDHTPGHGRRAITMVPDRHNCIIHAAQIEPDVPEVIEALDSTLPLTGISGTSATSDIELDRVKGVHGSGSFMSRQSMNGQPTTTRHMPQASFVCQGTLLRTSTPDRSPPFQRPRCPAGSLDQSADGRNTRDHPTPVCDASQRRRENFGTQWLARYPPSGEARRRANLSPQRSPQPQVADSFTHREPSLLPRLIGAPCLVPFNP